MVGAEAVIDRTDIQKAQRQITSFIRYTPVIALEKKAFGVPGRLWLKLESMQHTGSFKVRGAFNRILASAVPSVGVIAASGGNHGAAVAYAARKLGYPAEIFVPEIASPVKVDRIKSYGATVTIVGRNFAEALNASLQQAEKTGALVVHAYNQPEVIAGQGTIGCELEQQAPDLDTLLVAVGGGGLIGGISAWYANRVKVVAVEPELSAAFHAARKAGQPIDIVASGIAADSLGARRAGELMFAIAQHYVAESVLVSDQAIRLAQQSLWQELRLVTEPGGATALAALLAGAYQPEPNERVGVLICGANTDPETVK
ncbi:MAG: threonine/serine dehydratase [Elainellaceae cyanobacterium]